MLDGAIPLHRTMLVPADKASLERLLEIEDRNAVYPLDDLIGISGLPFKATEAAVANIAKEGIRNPSYERAAEVLNEKCFYNISPSQVKRITDYVGALVFTDDTKRAEEAKQFEGARIDRRRCKDDVLYIEFDGSYYLENIEDTKGCEWKECKIATAFKKSDMREWGNDSTEILKRDYVGIIGSSDEMKNHLLALAARNGLFETKTLVVITDGAKWILPMVRRLFPHAVPILDKFHAKENAGKFAMAVKRGKLQKKEYADHLCDLIDKGDVTQLLKDLEKYKDFKQKGVVNFYDYVFRLQDCMHYDEYEARGFLVGSGHIESTHRHVMQDRMKCSGQHWNRMYGQGILSLKSSYEADKWDEVEALISNDYREHRDLSMSSKNKVSEVES